MFKFLKSSRLSLILLAVIILLIFLHYLSILSPLENLLIRSFSPLQAIVYSFGSKINGFYSGLIGQKDLAQANIGLKNEVEKLTIENAQLKTLLQESQEFLAQKDFLTATGYQAVAAKVIGKNPETARQAIILNKGSADGVRIDLPVITSGGIIIGKISQVKKNSSEVILVNDSRSRVAAMIQNESNSRGVVIGEHGLSLKMELIPQNEVVNIDDLVVTSGIESSIPQGLVVGKVSRVLAEPNSFFQTVGLKSLIKIDNLTIVTILTMPKYD